MNARTVSAAPPRAGARARAAEAAAALAALAEVEEERAALSALLHDDVLQSMLAARFTAELTGASRDVVDAIRGAIDEAKAAMWALRPRTADGQLLDALDQLAARTGPRTLVTFRADGLPERIDPAAATVAFRVVQAAAAACEGTTLQVRVSLVCDVLTVSVADDGPPYDAVAYEPASDLTRWLARAGTLGGRARVSEGPAGGTTLWLEIPNALNEVAT
ncbi:MAG TPA: hypothetical protein VNA20_08825 [Frankiaceae bacterium]|nr:hypothetical protein [Frankiaceae bacterium]